MKGGGCHMASQRWQRVSGRLHQREDDIHKCILNLGIKVNELENPYEIKRLGNQYIQNYTSHK